MQIAGQLAAPPSMQVAVSFVVLPRAYDLLVIDLDGTLLRSDGTVSLRNIAALAAARASGMEVVVATGRSLAESREALQVVGHAGLVVAAGGSLLCHAGSGATIHRQTMPADLVREVIGWLLAHDHAALILKDAHVTGYDYLIVGEGVLDPASLWWFERMGATLRRAAMVDDDLHPHDSVRAGAVACSSRLAPLATQMRHELGERCCLQHWSAVTSSQAIGSATHLLEIFDCGVNKWTMVREHCRREGIDERRVAAIGDGLNDVELIASAGLGIAMANSTPEVMAVAQRVTSHHDADGVALAIDCVLSGDW